MTPKTAPILQISIPTYNRSTQIKHLIQDLHQLTDLIISGSLVIAVFDNSDYTHAVTNKENVELLGSYLPNSENIGFGANVMRCLTESGAQFTWVISDDDKLDMLQIRELVKILSELGDCIDGIALACEIPIPNRQNTQLCLGLSERYGEIDTFRNLIDPMKLPFDYLASFIIKTCLVNEAAVKNLNKENCYYQSLVFCTSITNEAKILIYGQPVVKWVGSPNIRWSVASLIKARLEVTAEIQKNFYISLNRAVLINEVLKWGVLSKIGFYTMPSETKDLPYIIKIVINLKSLGSTLYLILYLLPPTLLTKVVHPILYIKRLMRRRVCSTS